MRPGAGRAAPTGRVAWIFAGAGTVILMISVLAPPSVASVAAMLAPLGALVALLAGPRRYLPPAERRPWRALTCAAFCFLGGIVIRAILAPAGAGSGPIFFLSDLLTVPGYLLTGYGFIDMLRRRRAAANDPARDDALLIGLGTALAVWAFLIAPLLGARYGEPTMAQAISALFPVVDLVLLVLVVHLMLAGSRPGPAQWAMLTAYAAIFAGDLLFAMWSAGWPGLPVELPSALFTAAYVAGGTAVLHPSMRVLTRPQQAVVNDMGPARTAGLATVLIMPTVVAVVGPAPATFSGAVRVVLAVLVTLTAVVRIVRANNSRARAERAARRQATHDALTDLPNRELLTDTITRWCDSATEAGQQISLLFIDLDRFKMVNDHWGHQVGDELLCAVAGRLSRMVRSEDLVCRIGGDEFVVALASPSHSALAESLAARVVAEFAEPFDLSVGQVVVTPSIGVARSEGAADALELIRDADTAMYKAKDSGRNGYALFDASLRDRVRGRMNLEQALRGALDRGELKVYYQPIIDLATDELNGFEALMRWNHPELGAVSPMDFIPVAEDTGLIVRSGAWLLEEAANQLVQWRAERPPDAPPLHVSVNISVRQLRDGGLVDVVRRVLADTGLPPDALWLEITESGVMEDLETSLATLGGLRALGVTLAVDDFGTGYSSLSYLGRLPVGIVKVDRSFIAGVGEGGASEPIVRAVLAMAAAMGHRVVAEGVETQVQRDWLRALGCDLVQGWYYGAPRAADAQIDWVRRDLAGTRTLTAAD